MDIGESSLPLSIVSVYFLCLSGSVGRVYLFACVARVDTVILEL